MNFIKRIVLFLIINLLVVTTISIVLSILNVQPFLKQHGISYKELLIFCLAWGMGGAFISLALSRVTAKWMLGIKPIDPHTKDSHERDLLDHVYALARKAQLQVMPQVGIYSSPEVNAFATGPTKGRALIGVSSGLLQNMKYDEVSGVLAHEISHITNGDMVTMTLLQGIVNAFVMFLARVLALALSGFGKGEERRGSSGSFMLFTFIFQTIFMILGSMIICWYSRRREFQADAGGAKIAGKSKMIESLEALKGYINRRDPTSEKEALQTFKISNPSKAGWLHLFASHPPIEARIARLKERS